MNIHWKNWSWLWNSQYFGHLKRWLIWKDPDARKDWRQEEKGMTEDEMVGWHHWLIGMSLSKLSELVMDRETWRAAVHAVAKSRTWLRDWTELMPPLLLSSRFSPFFFFFVCSVFYGTVTNSQISQKNFKTSLNFFF